MRITRAAKVAAFPLTALILVALVACQGPVGPSGPSGPSRTVSGPSWTPEWSRLDTAGPSGVSSLEALNGEGHANTVVADYVDNTAAGEIGALMPIDVSDYFPRRQRRLDKVQDHRRCHPPVDVRGVADCRGKHMTTVKIRTAGTTTATNSRLCSGQSSNWKAPGRANFNPTDVGDHVRSRQSRATDAVHVHGDEDVGESWQRLGQRRRWLTPMIAIWTERRSYTCRTQDAPDAAPTGADGPVPIRRTSARRRCAL